MKSMFVVTSFDRPRSVPPVSLAQASGSAGDLLDVSKNIESLLKQVPPEALGAYQTEYKRCQDLLDKGGLVGLASGGKCLYDLYAKLKDVLKGKVPAMPGALPYIAPQSSFPTIPVMIGVLGGVALIWGVTRNK